MATTDIEVREWHQSLNIFLICAAIVLIVTILVINQSNMEARMLASGHAWAPGVQGGWVRPMKTIEQIVPSRAPASEKTLEGKSIGRELEKLGEEK